MQNVRIWFKKAGTAKYISHLDLTHCMARALKLSGLPVWYTQGFNPRIYMAFAMPLSLGASGERECMDIRLTEEVPFAEIPSRLNARLPQDIQTFAAGEPVHKLDAVAFADYEIRLETANAAGLQKQIAALLSRETVCVTKHGKKGDKELDIKPYFRDTAMEARSGYLLLQIRLPCSVSGGVNPNLLLDALKRYEGVRPYGNIWRKRLLLEDFSEIR